MRLRSTLAVCALLSVSCAYAYGFKSTVQHGYWITEADYDEAYSKTIFSLSELGYNVSGDKDTGTIQANRVVAGGFGTTTTITALLTTIEPGSHRLNLKIKSSDAYQPILDAFEAQASQHLQIARAE